MRVLGIETSCDEGAAAVVALESGRARILSDVVSSQVADHRPYGGVVPEIAARAHIATLDDIVARAMSKAGARFSDLDAVAVTAGPGLIGGLIVGLMTAQAIAATHELPLIPVNHLEGHALSVRLTDRVPFPFLLLLISGGHSQLLRVGGPGDYVRYGTTIDDAAGEAFDKTAKLLGLPYPGGPALEKLAAAGDPEAFAFPTPLLGRDHADFSFAGLKTAVARAVRAEPELNEASQANIAASFQRAVTECLVDRSRVALRTFRDELDTATTFVVAGGVAANSVIRAALQRAAAGEGFAFAAPPLSLCTDNGAMIAWAGIEALVAGHPASPTVSPRVRWPLDEFRAGAGLPHTAGAKGFRA